MKTIHGKTQGLKASQTRRLERLHVRNATQRQVCPPELARSLADCAADTGRMVGVLCDRRGSVTDVVLGEPTRLYLPDIGRLRAGAGRLRGLRLLVAKPQRRRSDDEGKRSELPFDHDLITDLERLKLDAVLLIEADDEGMPQRCALATILPGTATAPAPERTGFSGGKSDDADSELTGYARLLQKHQREGGARAADGSSSMQQERHRIERFTHTAEVTVDFGELVQGLEQELARTVDRVKDAARVPGQRDSAVLVGVYAATSGGGGAHRHEAQASMDELLELSRTAGVNVVDVIMQYRQALDGKTVVGSGKLEEICLTALHQGAEMIIFDRDLSPSQLNAITDLTDLKVVDRTMLILDIFARRAKSRGGRMQVELAQLKYSLPRLAKKQTGLSRLTGGIGGQGPGETKLEIDKRRVKEKITRLEQEIDRFSGERQLRRQRRVERDVPVIAIVGYTNAGKSTLLNALTGADSYAANELFATLDTTSRRLRFPEEREVVLIDTVGFIRDLPDTLVNAFRATLEELQDADLLLHVVDGSDERRHKHMEAVNLVLEELGLKDAEKLLVLNKADAVPADVLEDDREALRLKAVRVSAQTRHGLDALVGEMARRLWTDQPLRPGHRSVVEEGMRAAGR